MSNSLKEKTIEEMFADSVIPHLARYDRKVNGYVAGTLECEHCGSKTASRNRQRSAYVDSDNMRTLCPDCQKDMDEYYDDLWSNVPGY